MKKVRLFYPVVVFRGTTVDSFEVKRDHAHEREPDQEDVSGLPRSALILFLQELKCGFEVSNLMGQELD